MAIDACANSAHWSIAPIGSAEEQSFTLNFERSSLAFTSQGQPRIVAHISVSGDREGGISYIGCDADCDVGESWKRVLLYPRGQGIDIGWDIALDPQDCPRIAAPKALPLTCDQDVWEGLAPVLALDAAGNPRIAYDVSVEARCLYTDPTRPNDPPTTKFGQIWRGVRLIFFPQS